MKTLVVMRHAKADKIGKLGDCERPLSDIGVDEAISVGRKLLDFGFKPDLICCSVALRTHQTAQNVAEILEYVADIELNTNFYEGDYFDMLFAIQETSPKINNLMLVGHNPTCQVLVSTLLEDSYLVEFKTATAVVLTSDSQNWKSFRNGKIRIEAIFKK